MILRVFMLLYRLAWILLLPVVLLYLWHRGRRDALYARHLGERFGFYHQRLPQNAIWLHAVSLGETRSAVALIELMLKRGDKVVITNFTPTGRREARKRFASAIAAGQLAVVWVPFEIGWCMRRFLRACTPRIGLTLEVEVWPVMIAECRRMGVPLYMCNGQYASRPLARDSRGLRLRQRVMRGLSGAFVKSTLQAERFALIGLKNVSVTGELRFDQPIPPTQLEAARRITAQLPSREIITIASGTEGEEALYVELIRTLRAQGNAPLFVYVPRAPERFDAVAESLAVAGLPTLRRGKVLSQDLTALTGPVPDDTAVLLGDSLGEMYFYLALSRRVIVGGGFTPRGAHNIIEPLALGKPVLTGPHVWTIEYPFAEAEAAGIARSTPDLAALLQALSQPPEVGVEQRIAAFLQDHAGASRRTLAAIDQVLTEA